MNWPEKNDTDILENLNIEKNTQECRKNNFHGGDSNINQVSSKTEQLGEEHQVLENENNLTDSI